MKKIDTRIVIIIIILLAFLFVSCVTFFKNPAVIVKINDDKIAIENYAYTSELPLMSMAQQCPYIVKVSIGIPNGTIICQRNCVDIGYTKIYCSSDIVEGEYNTTAYLFNDKSQLLDTSMKVLLYAK